MIKMDYLTAFLFELSQDRYKAAGPWRPYSSGMGETFVHYMSLLISPESDRFAPPDQSRLCTEL